MQMYDWKLFWGNGLTANLPVPFGPANTTLTLDSEWIDELTTYYPKFKHTAQALPLDYIKVGSPRSAVGEEEHHWNMKGYK